MTKTRIGTAPLYLRFALFSRPATFYCAGRSSWAARACFIYFFPACYPCRHRAAARRAHPGRRAAQL